MEKLTIHIQPFTMQQKAIDENGNEYHFTLMEMPEIIEYKMPKEIIIIGNRKYAERYVEEAKERQRKNTKFNETKTKFTFKE